MEDVLDVYTRPYDAKRPVICMDESPKQLIGEVREPIPMQPGKVRKIDDEYMRFGTAEIFGAIEPLKGKQFYEVQPTRTKADWARFIKRLVDEEYADAEKIVLVMDNLNTHTVGSLYEAFSPEEAHRISEKLGIHYTPKHGSWLNIQGIGFSMLKRQCLPERVESIEELREQIDTWTKERNNGQHKVNWQFTTEDARIKLRRLYPEFE